MKRIDIHQHMQYLRLLLLDMSRVSQRSVDCSTKAHGPGGADFCADVQRASYEIEALYREIVETTNELLHAELPVESDLRFVISASLIAEALQNMRTEALEIAADRMQLLKNDQNVGCVALIKLGETVNGLMRLCVVAIFEQHTQHAHTVLHDHAVELASRDCYLSIALHQSAQASYELAIAKHLSHMADETHKIADAIVFWLEGMDRWFTADTDSEQPVGQVSRNSQLESGAFAF